MKGTRILRESMDMLIDRACLGAIKAHKSGKIYIQTMPDLPLRVVLHTITRGTRSQAPHEAKKTHLQLAIDCMSLTIFN